MLSRERVSGIEMAMLILTATATAIETVRAADVDAAHAGAPG